MTPLADLLVAPTATTVRAQAVQMLTSLGIPAGSWNSGGVASSTLTIICSLFASVIASLVTTVLSVPFLPVCPAAWLPLLAYYVYGVAVNQATYANGPVNLTNSLGAIYSFAANQAVFASSTTGVQYINTTPFTISALGVVTGLVVQSTTLGSAGSAVPGPGPGSIDTVVTPMSGVSVTNTVAIVGLDADQPALIITKCQAAIAARSYKGPQGAYISAIVNAVNATTGQPVAINRWAFSTDPTTGFITVWLASPDGAPTGADMLAAQLAINQVAQPMGVTATATAATVVQLLQTITVWAFGAGTVASSAIQTNVETGLDNGLSVYPISGVPESGSTQGYVYAAWLIGVIKASDPNIYDVQGLTANIALSAGQVAELTSSTTIVVRQIPGTPP